MAAFAVSFLCSSTPSLKTPLRPSHNHFLVSFPTSLFHKPCSVNLKPLICASSSDGIKPLEQQQDDDDDSRSKKSVLLKLIQEIEPLDVSVIQRDVPPTTVDAMKRTISGMLGLLPSDQFQVLIEALWKPLSKLLVSSLMTGYTLRNAEYRLCLERNFDTDEESTDKLTIEDSKSEVLRMLMHNSIITDRPSGQDELPKSEKPNANASEIPDLGQMTPEVQQYILKLQSRLFSVKKELHEVKRKNAALQMQQFVGEEKNELLDYLRSLQPEKVAELSEPTSADLKETIHSVVHGLLATLSPKMHSQAPHISESTSIGTTNMGIGNDVVENTSIQFQPLISLSRDYLARLLFWCMLLGHYLRGLEYRVELMELLSLPSNGQNEASDGEHVQ
ncbi:hypothetical protein CTI12_AA429400 [Artemisia annua]|uniref:MAR-binding filament-like protein 1 n=1 Tax=Artemisia annua TaxID=35608 RepID=A0A2U1M1S7_ARTAN|nr:hypothetical protein CTI12_AA429400 [Artemisia annua]